MRQLQCVLLQDQFNLIYLFYIETIFFWMVILWLASYGVTHRKRPLPEHGNSVKQALPGHQEAQRSSDTCDDDLGDIQNGAEWCRFTVASFVLGGCCKNTYTHTHTAATTTSMQRQTKTDWGPTGGLEMLAAHMQNIQWSCKGSMHPVIPDAVQWYRRQWPRHFDIQLQCRLSKSFN